MDDILFLKDVSSDKTFILSNGNIIKNVYELLSELKAMSDQEFSYHRSKDKDDFGNWIGDVLQERVLSELLKTTKSKKAYIALIEKAVKHREFEYEAQAHTVRVSKIWLENNKKHITELGHDLKVMEEKFREQQANIEKSIIDSIEHHVAEILQGHRSSFKQELEKTIGMNEKIEKRLETRLSDKEKLFESSLKAKEEGMEKIIHGIAAEVMDKHFNETLEKLKQALNLEWNRAIKMTDELNAEFKNAIKDEKQGLHDIATDAIDKEFSKSLEKHREYLKEEFERSVKKHKDFEEYINNDMKHKEQKIIADINSLLQKQLSDTLSKQRNILDNELAKALKTNKDFARKYEDEIRNHERALTETIRNSIEKHLEKTIDKYKQDLTTELAKIGNASQNAQAQFNVMMNTKSQEIISKLSDDLAKEIKKREPGIIEEVKENSINSINNHIAQELDKHIGQAEDRITKNLSSRIGKYSENIIARHKQSLTEEIAKLHGEAKLVKQGFDETAKGIQETFNESLKQESEAIAQKILKEFETSARMQENEFVSDIKARVSKIVDDHIKTGLEKESEIIENRIAKNVSDKIGKQSENLVSKHKKSLIDELAKLHDDAKDIRQGFDDSIRQESEAMTENLLKEFEKNARAEENGFINDIRSRVLKIVDEHIKAELEKDTEIIEAKLTKNFTGIVEKQSENFITRHKGLLNQEYSRISSSLKDLKKESEDSIKDNEMLLMKKFAESANIIADEKIKEYNQLIDEEKSKAVTSIKDLENKYFKTISEKESGIKDAVMQDVEKSIQTHLEKQLSSIDHKINKSVEGLKSYGADLEKHFNARKQEIARYANDLIEESIGNKSSRMLEKNNSVMTSQASKIIDKLGAQNLRLENWAKDAEARLTQVINTKIRDAIVKEFNKELMGQKEALKEEHTKVLAFNKDLDQRFEKTVMDTESRLISSLRDDTLQKINNIVEKHQEGLDKEFLKTQETQKALEKESESFLKDAKNKLDVMKESLSNKSKNLDKENKDLSRKIDDMDILFKRIDDALKEMRDIKELRKEITTDKSKLSKQLQKHEEATIETSRLRSELAKEKDALIKEKNELTAYRTKLLLFELMNRCRVHLRHMDYQGVKSTYDKITTLFKKIAFEKDEKQEIYKSIITLHQDIQATFRQNPQAAHKN